MFIAQLVSTGRVAVVERVNLDRILAEMRFQASDWADPNKTASLGNALSAQIIIRGKLMKMNDFIYWTATMLDISTARVMFSARTRISNMGQIFNSLPNFCNQLVERVNDPTSNQHLFTNVAVATFDVQGGVTPEEAAVVTELFIASLVSTRRVNVIDRTNFDAILQEMRFQTTDWSNRERTASLGRVLNATNVIRGQLMKMGDQIFWTATVLDVNTAQVLSSARLQLNNLDNIWEASSANRQQSNLVNFSQQIVSQLPPPNIFVGRWQSTSVVEGNTLYCIIDIKNDGTVNIERFDYANLTVNSTRNIFGDYRSSRTWGSPGRLTNISGIYNLNWENNERIRISIFVSGVFNWNTGTPIIRINATSNEIPRQFSYRLNNIWYQFYRDGRYQHHDWYISMAGSTAYHEFRKIN